MGTKLNIIRPTLISKASLVPRPTPLFVLRFAFNIIHGGALPPPCIILNVNRRTKKRGRPGNEANSRPSQTSGDQ